jgi:LCP family protein required for cell wall assembly
VLLVSGGLSLFFGHLNGNIATQSMGEFGNLPAASRAGVLNILALGSQTRDGQGPGFGYDPGTDLSDTSMLIHVNAAHTAAIVLSIPRDLLVYRPACRERVGGSAIVPAQQNAMLDSAMNLGGPACTVATVEAMSGIRIDHFVVLNFNGFRTMTDVLGGVQVCVPAPGIHDWRSHLNISAGLHTISGNEALAFVRDRHGIGNGGDLGRIRMQQMFLSSLIKKVMSQGTLTDPVTLYRIADAATKSVITDPGLGSVQQLLGLAQSLRGLSLRHITFVTLPNESDPTDVNRLISQQPAASSVWHLLRDDLPWSRKLPGSSRGTVAGASKPASKAAVQPAAGSATQSATQSGSGSAGGSSASIQTRTADENICANLPTPALGG